MTKRVDLSNSRSRRRVLEILCQEQSFKCIYCEFEIEVNAKDGTEQPLYSATIEHKISKKDGGTNTWDNLAASCLLCNGLKESHDHTRFSRVVKQLLENELIRRYWHQFSKAELAILRQEVELGKIRDKATKSKNTAWHAYRIMQRLEQYNSRE